MGTHADQLCQQQLALPGQRARRHGAGAGALNMDTHPSLETTRLKLRPFSGADIVELVPLIGTREVAATTLRIPHPYTEQEAKDFIAKCHGDEEVRLAITLRKDGCLCGGIGLRLAPEHHHAELGYWVWRAVWGRGS